MQTIFVQVKCELGHAYDVAATLAEIEGVSEVYSTSGMFDLLVKCYLETDEDIGHFVSTRIQTQKGIRDTSTLIAFNAFL